MPDPTPEQPPSWPPASEPAATPTNPPRITARGVGHLPSALPEDDPVEAAAHEPAPTSGDFADLTADAPLPNRTPDLPPPPPPVEPEVPRQQQWGEAPDMSGEWPPRENQDWISQQARNGGWNSAQSSPGAPPWPGPAVAEPEPPAPAEQSYQPNPNAAPYGSEPYQAAGSAAETFAPDPYQTGTYQGGRQDQYRGAQQADPYGADPYQASPQAPAPPISEPPPPEPAAAEPEPPRSQTKPAPPTHAGVRYAIYGIGGIITLGLIIAIVIMLGGPPASEPSDDGEDDGGGETSSDGKASSEGLDAERYAELAGAVGTAEWFEYRYGTPGENGASEEVPAVEGDAVTAEPLFGDADRSVQGQLAYLADDAELSGIDHVSVLESTDDALGIAPRPGGRFSEEGVPELELTDGSTADCVAGLGGELGAPVALARPEQSGEINAHAVIAFSSGILATTGISGAQGGTCLQLPEGLVPTDVALTDGNELALVTTWNPADQTGALVVVALADKAGSYNSSWSEPYPGLPNPGHFGTAEVVGQVALPLTAPTSVDAWSDSSGSMDTGRTTVEEDAHADTVATAAYALIGSLSESEAVTVDLTAVLTGLAAKHIEGAEFAFEAAASEPVAFEGGVADVAVNGETFAVATGDGVVHELDAALSETAAVEVGPNPTCLVVGAQSGQFIATSRGDSAVRWVSGGEVVNELTDARLTDAVCASETPALDVQGYAGNATVLLVSDFEGKALHTYLVGKAALPSGAEVGGEGFAYGGAYTVQGRPFDASVTLDLE
ncbi:hypothetical protein [Glycomyces arizonensis]|uniref:hypothetical protein n=1 Tax=Glycomyces arizonensis TaxID=256035 RepID=UPI0012EC68F3|nr:hypothetical protein [Glycomyces arizonensis]